MERPGLLRMLTTEGWDRRKWCYDAMGEGMELSGGVVMGGGYARDSFGSYKRGWDGVFACVRVTWESRIGGRTRALRRLIHGPGKWFYIFRLRLHLHCYSLCQARSQSISPSSPKTHPQPHSPPSDHPP
jgi:hypothetical protein